MLKGPVIIVPGPVRSATIIRGVSNPSVWFCKLNDPVVRDPGSGAWYCIPLRVFRGYSFDSNLQFRLSCAGRLVRDLPVLCFVCYCGGQPHVGGRE